MEAVVIETNVLATANGHARHVQPEDVIICIDALKKASKKQRIVIDSAGRIFDEYFRHASRSGQTGVGDFFARWLFDNQGYRSRCERVNITAKEHDPDDFEEFPDDSHLAGFDRSDRKFVAVALASRSKPRILNATDTDWWIYRSVLEDYCIVITFLCPKLMREP